MGLVARNDDGVFIIGHDHLKRAMIEEERVARRFPTSSSILS